MFKGVKNGMDLIKVAIRALIRYPRMLVPLLLCWLVYAPLLVVFRFHIPWEDFTVTIQLLISFSGILLLSIIFTWSAYILLEVIRQIETNESPSLFRACYKSIVNTAFSLPIAITWAAIWLIISILEAIFRRGTKDEENEEYNAENVAKTIAGYEEFSLSGAFFHALKKGVRMAAFLIYPAIAWENKGVFQSVKKGLGVANAHRVEFATGHTLTGFVAVIVFIPPGVLFYLSGKLDVSFPDPVWFGTMIYCAFAWSFCLFLEQMFTAELYLWHLFWEKEVKAAKSAGKPEPKLQDIKRPSIIDDVADLTVVTREVS